MANTALDGKPYAGNPHVRIDEGDGASAKPRRSSLLYKTKSVLGLVAAIGGMAFVNAVSGASTASLLAHRWSFNGDYTDSTGGLTAVPTGNLSFSEDGKLVFPGGAKGTGNLDLGENALSVGSDSVTIEIWAQQDQALQFARLFEYYPGTGGDKNNDMYMSWNTKGNNVNTDKIEVKSNGAVKFAVENSLQPYTLGVMYHISMAFRANADGSTTVTWAKRNTGTGVVEKSGSQTIAGWTLSTFHQFAGAPRLRLGCSLWGENDPKAHYDEVRVWRGELSPAQLDFNAAAGPDRLPFEVETYVDGMPAGQLAHRWSFNGNYNDSVGGMTAVPTGSPSFSAADQLVLPGGNKGTGNVALGANVLAYDGNCATIEIWAQQNQALQFARLFEYYPGSGSDKNNDMYMSWNTKGNNVNTDKVEVKSNGAIKFAVENSLQPYTLGVMYHISMTFLANADGSTTVTWAKRNSESGAVEKTGSQTVANWTLATFHQYGGTPVFRLGCSLWGESDPCANYDEVRIWNTALSSAQLTRNAVLGANALPDFYPVCAVAHWTGAGAAGKLDDPANWACTNTTGQAMAGALPGINTKVVFSGTVDIDIPSNVTLCCSEVEFGNATLAADRDWRGVPACVKLGGYLNLNGHKFLVSTLTGMGAIDDVSTDAEHPGELHLETPAGALALGDVRMAGNLKLVKSGPGTLTLRRTGQTYTGGTLIAGGTVRLGSSMLNGAMGMEGTDIQIDAGGFLDANGTFDNYNHPIILNGGKLGNMRDVSNYDYEHCHFGNVRLTADSEMEFKRGGLLGQNFGPIVLDLQGHTLTWTGSGSHKDGWTWFCNTTVLNGTLIANGDWVLGRFSDSNPGVDARTATVEVRGKLGIDGVTFKAGNYICNTTSQPHDMEGAMTVSGTFTPKTNYFFGFVAQNGATFDLSEQDLPWSTTGLVTVKNVPKTVTFADNAKITIATGERVLRPNDKLVAWDAKPANADTLKFVLDGTVKQPLWVRDDGIYVGEGGMVIFVR